jgi:hypothetical protein
VKSKNKIILVIILCVVFSGIIYIIWNNISSDNEITSTIKTAKQEVNQELENFRMIKRIRHRDLILRKENFTKISEYQKYVTPNEQAVQVYRISNGINIPQDAYAHAVNWIWISDSTLHGKPEQWLLPSEFILNTSNDPDNPVPGEMASDCESQAYTLVSLIEASGTSNYNVRVVVGEVDFNGEVGGHAWVQIYRDGDWFELDPTSGPYWDDDEKKLIQNNGFYFTYFKTRPYPVKEYWAFFNDKFYYNPNTGKKSPDLPDTWLLES